ncbi:hypothetical protein TIFTF001_021619 [Ficus carica]|uniref:Uncharacterized protein n=1 Tax=Ficus carica TaxID=3494 RepID=A0AA88AHT5_FICCA|nr:hypothetical protein TIFTF001_021619 [Ficus carica]
MVSGSELGLGFVTHALVKDEGRGWVLGCKLGRVEFRDKSRSWVSGRGSVSDFGTGVEVVFRDEGRDRVSGSGLGMKVKGRVSGHGSRLGHRRGVEVRVVFRDRVRGWVFGSGSGFEKGVVVEFWGLGCRVGVEVGLRDSGWAWVNGRDSGSGFGMRDGCRVSRRELELGFGMRLGITLWDKGWGLVLRWGSGFGVGIWIEGRGRVSGNWSRLRSGSGSCFGTKVGVGVGFRDGVGIGVRIGFRDGDRVLRQRSGLGSSYGTRIGVEFQNRVRSRSYISGRGSGLRLGFEIKVGVDVRFRYGVGVGTCIESGFQDGGRVSGWGWDQG